MRSELIEARTKIKTGSLKDFEWFSNTYLKANSTKSHAILTTDNMVQVNVGSNISNRKTLNP